MIGVYVGTNDNGATETDPTGGGAPGNNMVLVTTNVFDGGSAGGDGNLTKVIQQVDATTQRVWNMTFDFRDRQITKQGPINYFELTCHDNLNRVARIDRYDTTGPSSCSSSSSSSSSTSSGSTIGNLIARKATNWDDRSRVYQSMVYGVDPTTGIVGNALTDNTWFDSSGNVIKSFPAGSSLFTKMNYDSLGRVMAQYSCYGPDSTYSDAQSVANNTVIEQAETVYDAASNVILNTKRQR